MIPPYIHDSLQAYIDTGRPTGDFLKAVICNDLRGAVLGADESSRAALLEIVHFMHWEAPSECWGERKAWAAWIGHQGLKGWPSEHRKPRET